jgi:RNA polymerase sigma-54 factor
MSIAPRLEFRQTQNLVMTPQLRQAIKLLQYSHLEVAAFVEEALESNPLLDRDERDDESGFDAELPGTERDRATAAGSGDIAAQVESGALPERNAAPLDGSEADFFGETAPGEAMSDGYGGAGGETAFSGPAGAAPEEDWIDSLAESRPPLREHLAAQLRLNIHDRVERLIGAQIIAQLEPSGRVSVTDAEFATALGTPLAQVAAVRAKLMRFDPVGVLAPDLRTCLAVQLAERRRLDPAMSTLLDHLDLLAARDMRRLMGLCGVDAEDLADMLAEIRRLDPKPGADWSDAPAQVVQADVLMRRLPDGSLVVEMNPDTLPRLLVREGWYAQIAVRATREQKAFLADQLAQAQWLVRSLAQRSQTVLKVAAEIMRRQEAFLAHGISRLRPLILRDIAEEVELHESTVSRVTSGKYIATPRGLFELKFFFTTAIAATGDGESHSAASVRERIRTLVDGEPPDDILSDDAIVEILRKEGVDIARRTVAKYRDALRIPSSVQRRRIKALVS